MYYYHVLLKNVPQLLTYQSPTEIPIGSLVEVTLAKKSVNGVIWEAVAKPEYNCVSIQQVHLTEALSPLQKTLCEWMSSYYFASLQQCVQLFIPTVIWNQRTQPQREQFVKLHGSLEEAQKACQKAKKQLQLVNSFADQPKQALKALKQSFSTTIIKAVMEKGLLTMSEGQLDNPDDNHQSKPYHDQPLTAEQQAVLDRLLLSERAQQSLKTTPGDQPYLLHGITGSGKTEIYLQLINKSLSEGKQSILLVPEIALTTELIQYFCGHFPEEISIIHSKLSDRERVQAWHRIHKGDSKLILGSRSALFTPWKNLDNIIVDEEHEWTYKQESSPRYHVRTVIQQISQLSTLKPTLLLGSATPSIESFHQAGDQVLTLKKRATDHPLPPVQIVDLREEFMKKNFSMISEALQQGIQQRLDQQEQIVLFLNKRGSSSSLTCRDCGFSPTCENCDICLTYHSKLRDFQNGGLICHYCGSFHDNLSTCPECHSAAIRYLGTGTQKAEQQLAELFPTARILRADKDTTGGKDDFNQIYHQMKDGKADILLGTQMIAKGLDLPNVTLTGVLLADIGLHIPDFRASERVFQLLTQVAGRSGRHKPGEVIIQTYQPHHPAIRAAQQHDYAAFYNQEIEVRKQHAYAPFSQSIKLIYAHENAKTAANEALRLFGQLQDLLPKENPVPGHSPALQAELAPHYIPKLHGKYLWNILIRGQQPRELLEQIPLPKGWKIDVDPQ